MYGQVPGSSLGFVPELTFILSLPLLSLSLLGFYLSVIFQAFFRRNHIPNVVFQQPRRQRVQYNRELDGSPEIGAHVRSKLCYLFCLRRLIRLVPCNINTFSVQVQFVVNYNCILFCIFGIKGKFTKYLYSYTWLPPTFIIRICREYDLKPKFVVMTV